MQFGLSDALLLEPAHQILKGVHHMGADVAADEDAHDIVPHLERSRTEPSLDVVNAI